MAEIDRLVAEEGVEAPGLRTLARQHIDKERVSTLIDHRELQWLFAGRGIRIRRVLAQRLKWPLAGRG